MFILKYVLNFIVRKRRYFLLGVIISCFLVLVLSVSGLLQFTAYVKREKQPMLKNIMDEASKQKQRFSLDYNLEDVTQQIYGLYLPNYDKEGKLVSVMRAAYAVFLKNKIYKVTNPEIEFLSSSDKESKKPENIIATSDFAEIDKDTNEGFLFGNVIIRLEENLKIYTDDLEYLPEEVMVKTDGPVRIKGEGTKITGTGFEVSMQDSKAWVKNDPEMRVSGSGDISLFSSNKKTVTSNSKKQPTTRNGNVADDIFIRSSGELVFENREKQITFYDNVRASKGKSTIFSDKFSVIFDSNMGEVSKIKASGNILASDGTKTAKGESLIWDAEKGIATLEDEPIAEFYDDKLSVTASKIMFFKNENEVNIPVGGQLVTKAEKESKKNKNMKSKLSPASSGERSTREDITINWKKSMTFQQDNNLVIFEGDVITGKEGMKLYCGRLEVLLDDESGSMQRMEATEDVHFIQKKDDTLSEARGSKLIWSTSDNFIELYGDPLASVKDGQMHLSAPKILFSEEEKDLFAEGKGNLLIKSYSKKEKITEFIDISWNRKMVHSDKNKTANFYENVVVNKGGEKLNCDRLDVIFHGKSKVKKIIALGNVYILSSGMGETEGLGTLLVWDFPTGHAVLTGNPLAELRQEGSRTYSEKIYFDTNTQRVHWEGKPHWQIYQKKRVN